MFCSLTRELEKKFSDRHVVFVGQRRILGKPEYLEEASSALHLLSGRSHWVYTAIGVMTPSSQLRLKVCETKVRFKRIGGDEMRAYLASGEWRGKAGGYAAQVSTGRPHDGGFEGQIEVTVTGS